MLLFLVAKYCIYVILPPNVYFSNKKDGGNFPPSHIFKISENCTSLILKEARALKILWQSLAFFLKWS